MHFWGCRKLQSNNTTTILVFLFVQEDLKELRPVFMQEPTADEDAVISKDDLIDGVRQV